MPFIAGWLGIRPRELRSMTSSFSLSCSSDVEPISVDVAHLSSIDELKRTKSGFQVGGVGLQVEESTGDAGLELRWVLARWTRGCDFVEGRHDCWLVEEIRSWMVGVVVEDFKDLGDENENQLCSVVCALAGLLHKQTILTNHNEPSEKG